MSEYCRAEHGEISGRRLINWIDSPNKLGVGFSTMEIPDRLFYIIANCANTHTKWDFDEVLKLHQEDSGFAHDYVHPRFIAILLQLGDALDMDNDRFHPLFKEYLGDIPRMSEIHYGKHKAIRRLRITNQKISINADCKNQDILRLVRQECDGIKSILKNAAYYWAVTCPKELNIGLPVVDSVKLLLDGNEIPEELVEAKFEIPQDKAFHLLEGNNIYEEGAFVFLREFLQNAIDASKIQYFRDCKQQMERAQIKDISKPNEIKKVLSPLCYPVEMNFTIAKCKKQKFREVRKEDLEGLYKEFKDMEFGVLVHIQDYGTGISEEDINQIAKVGTSFENRKEEIEIMPKWLQTTGIFGIGLQSAFLSSSVIVAETFTRKEECYEITFYPKRSSVNGYINVKPIKNEGVERAYGTSFKTFIPYDKKKLHKDSPETWDGTDPFEEGYDENRIIRHSRELMKQMVLYLADMVGEPLFPINLRINDELIKGEEKDDLGKSGKYYNEEFIERFQNSGMMLYINGKKMLNDYSSAAAQISWAYNLDDNKNIDVDGDDMYFLNTRQVKLYVWNHKYNAFACLGIGRILAMRDNIRRDDKSVDDKSVDAKIFYKGIKVSEMRFKQDADLIEYIDLKDSLNEDLLRLNRNGFSEKGREYLEEVYRAIVITVRKALKFFAERNLQSKSVNKSYDMVDEVIKDLEYRKSESEAGKTLEKLKSFLGNRKWELAEVLAETDEKNKQGKYSYEIVGEIRKLLNDKNTKLAQERVLSVAALVYFATVSEENGLFREREQNYKENWNMLLKDIQELIGCNSADNSIYESISQNCKGSTLFNIPCFKYRGEGKDVVELDEDPFSYYNTISVLDIINMDRKFAIVSERDKGNELWTECIIEIGNKKGGDGCSNTYEHIREKIRELHVEYNVEKREAIMEELNGIAYDIVKEAKIYKKHVYDFFDLNQIRKYINIVKWFLNNVPTIALFSSEDENTRVNVLGLETCDSIYFDMNIKKMIISRMLDMYKKNGIFRFSTTVWSGYRFLGLEQNRNSILSVNRGKMSDIGRIEMIFPLTGQELSDLLYNDEIMERAGKIVILYQKNIKPFLEYMENNVHDNIKVINRFWAKMYEFVGCEQKVDCQNIDFLKKDKVSIEECRGYVQLLLNQMETENGVERQEIGGDNQEGRESGEEQDKNISMVLKIIRQLKEECDKLAEFDESWNKTIIEKKPYKNMVKYVTNHAKMLVQQKQIETLYSYYLEEVRCVLKEIKQGYLKSQLKDRVEKEFLRWLYF